MSDYAVPQNLTIPHGTYIVDPSAGRYGLKVNSDGSINVTGSFVGTNPSVGPTGSTAPVEATEIAWVDNSGNLQAVSNLNPLPVAGTFSSGESVLNVTGSASSAAVLSNFPVNPTTGYRTAAVQITAITSGNTVVAEESNDGTTWSGIQIPQDMVSESATPMTAAGRYLFPVSMLRFRLRMSVFSSGTAAVNVELRQAPIENNAAVVGIVGTVAVSDSTTHTELTTINTTLGSPIQTTGGTVGLVAGSAVVGGVELVDSAGSNKASISAGGALKVDASATTQPVSGTVTVQQATAASLNATVVNAAGSAIIGKVGIDQTTPGTTNGVQVNAALPAGTNLLGKTSIDQTTPGTTNAVSLAQIGATTVASGTGAVGNGSQRVAVGTDTATIAGSAPGTAGAASTNVLSIQGIASMTAVQVASASDLAVVPATDNFQSGAISVTGTSSTSVITSVSGKRIYVTGFSVSNSSATAVTVAFQDGSGGTTLWTVEVPAGGGNNLGGMMPLFRTSASNALYTAASGSATTVYINAAGFSQ